MILLISDIGDIFGSIGVVVVCVFLFIGTYILNKRTKKPEGCDTLDCEGCSMTSCSHHPEKQKNKEKEGEENHD